MWRTATVVGLQDETATARTLALAVHDWPGHVAGQHVDVRLTAADGYSAVRSYSIASAPSSDGRMEITVDRLPNGEVSPYLTQQVVGRRSSGGAGPNWWLVCVASRTIRADSIGGRRLRYRSSHGHDSVAPFGWQHRTNSITDLAKISALRVISRTSVMQYKGSRKPIAEVARELNIDALLEGTVARDQNRIRITAQLIRAAPEKHLWADKYEGSLSEVLSLQDKVAQAVANEIQITVTPHEQAMLAGHREVDPLAYQYYSKGRYLWEISGEENLEKSRHYFEQAIEKDPGYALAWAGLADAYSWLASWGVVPRQEAAPRARAAAEKAPRTRQQPGRSAYNSCRNEDELRMGLGGY